MNNFASEAPPFYVTDSVASVLSGIPVLVPIVCAILLAASAYTVGKYTLADTRSEFTLACSVILIGILLGGSATLSVSGQIREHQVVVSEWLDDKYSLTATTDDVEALLDGDTVELTSPSGTVRIAFDEVADRIVVEQVEPYVQPAPKK